MKIEVGLYTVSERYLDRTNLSKL